MLHAVILFCLGLMVRGGDIEHDCGLLKGPDLPDRILALDTLYINAICADYSARSVPEFRPVL